jgi:hypothetical protein
MTYIEVGSGDVFEKIQTNLQMGGSDYDSKMQGNVVVIIIAL